MSIVEMKKQIKKGTPSIFTSKTFGETFTGTILSYQKGTVEIQYTFKNQIQIGKFNRDDLIIS